MTVPGSIRDVAGLTTRLVSAGMSSGQAAKKAEMIRQAASALADKCESASGDWHSFFVPGRIEVLGKHTDYAGGRSLICAVERGICLVCAARADRTVWIIDAGSGQRAEFTIAPDLEPPVGHWSNYPITVASRLARNFGEGLLGADIAFISDLPPAAGMSSSSALIVAFFLAISGVNELHLRQEYMRNIDSQESMAGYLATVENGQSFGSLAGLRGVGTFGGSEDHTAILCGRPGELLCYSYCPVRLERAVPVPGGYVFAVAASGVVAAKTGDAMEKYNRASRLASAVVAAWNQATGREDPHIAAALASSAGAADRMRRLLGEEKGGGFVPAELLKRFEHFLAESEQIVPSACDALAGGELAEFGRHVDRSQKLTEELLGNQVPQTIFLARSARQVGACGASAFGAGFGGAVWALAPEGGAEEFLGRWRAAYLDAFGAAGEAGRFFTTRPGPAAFPL